MAIDGTPSLGPNGRISAPAGTTLYDGGSYTGSSITPTPTSTGGPLPARRRVSASGVTGTRQRWRYQAWGQNV